MSDTFVNPYNFISLPKDDDEDVKKFRKEYAEGVSEKKSLTGKLVCHLIPRTEIIIPDHEKKGKRKEYDTKKKKEVDYDEYPFMTISEQPMIPGSSIRGMIRSIYEILTYSCMFLNDEYNFSSCSSNVYMKSPLDLLPESLHKCKEKNSLCPACTLFGFVASEGKEALGSRIRFTDADYISKEAPEMKTILLPILSSPRTSALEFYLRSERYSYNADTVDEKGKPAVELSGRKVYWHHSEFNPDELKGEQNSELTSYMQYFKRVKEGEESKFEFEVYFDGISERELKQLYTALTFGENCANGSFCHKIGHGKPLGFGSVKVFVDKILTREFDIKSKKPYVIKEMNIDEEPLAISLPPELEKVADFKSEAVQGQKIDYPRLKKDGESYEWFSKNRLPSSNKYEYEYKSKLPKLPKKSEDSVAQFRDPDRAKRNREQENSNEKNKPNNQRDFSIGEQKKKNKDNSKNIGTNMGDF